MLGLIVHQLSTQIWWVLLSLSFFFFPKGVRKRAFFIVLISEITRCIYEMALVNQWDNVREGYEGLKMEGVAKKCRFQVGVRDNILISSSNLSFRMLPC